MKSIEFNTDKIEVVSIISDEDVREDLEDKDRETIDILSEDNKDYIYITDESERSVREAERVVTPGSGDEGGVFINTPKVFSWPTICTALVFICTIIFNLFNIYEAQSKFNDRTDEVLQRHRDDLISIKDNMITRKEEELQHKNTEAEIKRLEHLIELLQKDVEKLENRR